MQHRVELGEFGVGLADVHAARDVGAVADPVVADHRAAEVEQHDLAPPVQAAASSAASFGVGAALPLIAAAVSSRSTRIGVILAVALLALVALGVAGAKVGGAKVARPIVRIVVGGVLAMAFTMLVGKVFGAAVG